MELVTDAELARGERLGGHYVFLDGAIYAGARRIDIADVASFRVIADPYAIDANHIYYATDGYWRIVSSPMHYTAANELVVVDRETFEVLGHGFARDRERVYWHNDVLLDVARDSFVALSPHVGRDADRGYYFYSGIHESVFEGDIYRGIRPIVLVGANPRTLVVLGEQCARDDQRVYWHSAVLPIADVASVEVLDSAFLRTSTQVFFEGDEIEGVDAKSFEVIAGTGYARDAYRVFETHDSDHGSWVTVVANADPRAFVPLGGAYTLRGGRVFAQGTLLDVDPASFVVLTDGYARDGDRLYSGGDLLATGAFTLLGDGFATTPQHVYLYGTLVADADPSTFRIVDETHVADAQRTWIRCGEYGEELRIEGDEPATPVATVVTTTSSDDDIPF